MKTRLVYLLLFLCCFGIGCQEKYSDAILVEYAELDKSLKRNNNFIEHTTRELIMKLAKNAMIRTQLQFLAKKAKKIHDASIDLNTFIDGLRDSLTVKTGGYYEKEEVLETHKEFLRDLPKGARNIDLVEDILFRDNFSALDSTAILSNVIILDQKIHALYDQYVQIIESCWDDGGLKGSIFADIDKKEAVIQSLKKQLSLPSSIHYKPKAHNNQTWAEFKFKDKPLVAVLPFLSKIQNDIKLSEYALISFFNAQFSGGDIFYDSYDVFAQSSKSSIRLGETYEAEIAFGTYSSEATFEIEVNGDTLNQTQGKAIYRVRPDKTGEQHYNATIHYTHPATGETTTFRKAFYFEVIP
jgi:hypothetical protein